MMIFKKIFCTLVVVLFTTTTFSQEIASSDIENRLKGKNPKEIKQTLDTLITNIDSYLNFSSMRISGGPATRRTENENIPNFFQVDESSIANRLQELANNGEVTFYQELYDQQSELELRIPYDFSFTQAPYDDIDDWKKETITYKAIYSNGKATEINQVYGGYEEPKMPFSHKIDSASFTVTTPYIVQIQKATISKEQTEDKGMKLSFIKDNEVEFSVPYALQDKVFYVEALDEQGKALRRYSYNRISENGNLSQEHLILVNDYLKETVAKIESKKLKSKKKIIAYLAEHFPEMPKEKAEPSVIYYNTYAGNISAVNVYYNAVIKEKTQDFTLKNSTKYNNGIATAQRIVEEYGEEYLMSGLMNEKGKWVVQPQFYDIRHQIGNIYYARKPYEDDENYYFLKPKTSKFEKLPYYLPFSNYYYDKRYAQITDSPNNNKHEGILDIKTMKVLLAPADRSIEVNESFYVSISDKELLIDNHQKRVNAYQKEVESYQAELKRIEELKQKGLDVPPPPLPPLEPEPPVSSSAYIAIPSSEVSHNHKPATQHKSEYYEQKTYYISVYRFSDNKKILSSHKYDEIYLDKDRIIVREPTQPKEREASDDKYFYEQYHLFDSNGKKLNKMMIKDITGYQTDFNEKYILILDGKRARQFIDRNGNKAPFDIKAYKEIEPFKNGFAQVCVAYKKCSFINTKGKLIAPAVYASVYDFADGYARVGKSSREWGYINKEGKEIVPLKYAGTSDFFKGYAKVMDLSIERYILINTKGEKVATFPESFEESYINEENENKCYIFDDRTFNYKGEETTDK